MLTSMRQGRYLLRLEVGLLRVSHRIQIVVLRGQGLLGEVESLVAKVGVEGLGHHGVLTLDIREGALHVGD